MTVPLVIIGAGGFGREALDVVAAMNETHRNRFEIVGVVDSAPSLVNISRLEDRGISYLGTETEWLSNGNDASFVVGVGDPIMRSTIAARWIDAGRSPVTLVHPSAIVGGMSTIGAGSVVCAGVQISTNVRLGEYVHLNPNVTVGHDSALERCVSINPGAIVSGEVQIGTGSLVGAGAVILAGLNIGRDSVVGAAACVVRDVEASTVVKGVPAR
ncbi:acetyltransferase [Mycetocola manganoxydans]|nr:acetyltransferase [Mycetocola manganoxydans]